jgi:hypothetical protein
MTLRGEMEILVEMRLAQLIHERFQLQVVFRSSAQFMTR